MRIKAISLHQPWASLVAVGAKQFETRGWFTNYRGRLAIHASKHWTGVTRELCEVEPFRTALDGHALPLGYVIAVCEVTGCFATDDERFAQSWPNMHSPKHEYAFGDWSPGRFAWRLENVRCIDPVPFIGRQGFFWVELQNAA